MVERVKDSGEKAGRYDYITTTKVNFNCFQGFVVNIKSESECRRCHCLSRDLTTVQRILGRLAGHFIGETNFQSRYKDGLSVVKR